MIDREDIYNKYIRPFAIVEKLKLKCGYEKSFKLMYGHLLRNRYLLAINVDSINRDIMSFICSQMGMPNTFSSELYGNYDKANQVLLGFEEGHDDCIYKIYLEFWDEAKKQLRNTGTETGEMTLFLGFKWSAFDINKTAVTSYKYYPLLVRDEIIGRIEDSYDLSADMKPVTVIKGILDNHTSNINADSLRYLEASENDGKRKSFDLNLYQAGINIGRIYAYLKELGRHYAVPDEEIGDLVKYIDARVLGHISGGIDRQGRGFTTFYYEAEPAA